MSRNLNKREAPLAMLAEGKVEFVFRVAELVSMRQACQALKDFRYCGIDNMRKLHANNKLMSEAIEGIVTEEDVIRDLHNIVYGPESSKLSVEELTARTQELQRANKEYSSKEHIVSLYTIPNDIFKEHLADLDKFPKKMVNNVEVDTILAYLDLCSEGIIV